MGIIADSPRAADSIAQRTKLEWALALAAEGFEVLPLRRNEKVARIKKWQRDATTETNQISAWWTKWPDANIGIFTGRFREGALVVVDIDRKHGNDGFETAEALELGGDALSDTRMHATASGGAHVLYYSPKPLKQGVHVLGRGLDIRADGGYIVAPGSTIDGKPYAVASPAPLATVPEWVAAKCGAARPKKTAATKAPPAIVNQERATERAAEYLKAADGTTLGAGSNDGTYKVAAKVKDFGLDQSAALDLMLEYWNPRCSPPWPPEKLAVMIAHAFEYGQESPGVAAPEVVFQGFIEDAFNDASAWPLATIRKEAPALLQLRTTDPARFADLADLWQMMGTTESADLAQLMDDADLARASGIDIVAIAESPDRIHEAATRRALATLKARAGEISQRVEARLTTGSAPLVKLRKFSGTVAAGEKAIKDEAATADALASGKQIVRYSGDSLVETSDEVEQIILTDHAQGRERVFSYAGNYVCLRKRAPATVRQLAGGGYPDQPLVMTYTPAALRERIQRAVTFKLQGRNGDAHAGACPDLLVQTLMARRGGTAPALTGIIEAPTIRPDGSLLDAPGYDDATGLFAWFEANAFEHLPDSLTQEAAARAREYLRDHFLAEFCFETDIDRDVAIAALLTALTRRALNGFAPGYVFSATQQSSGKTALVSAIYGAAFGRPAPAVAWPRTDDEMNKVLLSQFREGQSGVVFDNVEDGKSLASPPLASAMTSLTYSGRMLHTLDHVEYPTNITWFITGNNVGVVEDLATRFLVCDMDPKDERPDQRAFSRGDLPDWVARHRAKIVGAAITILRAYGAAGSPNLSHKPSRFGAWDRAVRLPLVYAGGCDVGVKFDKAHDNDSGLATYREFLNSWRENFGDREMAAGAVMDAATVSATFEAPEGAKLPISRALIELMGVRQDRRVDYRDLTAKAIGECLAKWKGRPAGGFVFRCRKDSHSGRNLYRVEATA